MDLAKIQELLDKEAIREIRYQYAQALDYQDWALLESLFVEELETDFTVWGVPPQKVNRTDFVNNFRHNLSRAGLKTQHIFSNFRISLKSDTATSTFYQLAQHYIQGFENGEEFFLRAEYSDKLVRTATGWKISGVTLNKVLYTVGNPAILVS